ncbi:MAG: Gfo/Idh/MocA family oxidoreductase [Puniceicoccales bacterium]|nr:Gfo/Idh/MocA family oxidoreductase [Puniceicoccales bacterium]
MLTLTNSRLRKAASASLPLLAVLPQNAFAAGAGDRLKVGIIGSGQRGTEAAQNILDADPDTQLWAFGDAFADQAKKARNTLAKLSANPKYGTRATVPESRVFSGFDNHKDVLNSGIDIVILAGPPGFRPQHLLAAAEKGVHIFAEKPFATDPAGVRIALEAVKIAEAKKLALVAGTIRRHDLAYVETMKRVHGGEIGDLLDAQIYFTVGELWHRGRGKNWSDMEYQMRNWLYFTWLSGDHIVEQHIHNIDAMNWAFRTHPLKAFGMGGRQTRTDPRYGDAFDHFAVEYEFPNGVRVQSFCRQANGAAARVSERLVGTKGVANCYGNTIHKGNSRRPTWRYSGPRPSAYVQEHADMLKSIRAGAPLNEGRELAESTLTAILGRMSAYTGREVGFNWALNASKLDLFPKQLAWGEAPKVEIAVPGVTPLV